MKKLILSMVAILWSTFALNATVTEDFNHGSECYSRANCWKFCNVDVRSRFYGCYSYGSQSPMAQTSSLYGFWGCYSTAKLYSPYVAFNGTGNVTFTHKLSSNSGKYRYLQAYLVDDQGHLGPKIFDHTYIYKYNTPNGNPTNAITVSIPVTWTGTYRIKWFWLGYKGSSRGIIDDIVIDGTYASDPWNWCKPIQTCPDADGDGCCDSEDEYPNDPTKCDNYYEPSENTYNTVAYEDLWPYSGDYDFNDKVVDRYSTYALDNNGDVVSVTHKIKLRAAGAGYHNGFAINMPDLSPNDIASVTGAVNPLDYTILNSNGTEANQSSAVVIVWEDWVDIVTWGGGPFFNTVPGDPQGTSDTVTIVINFATPQDISDMTFDPFLIKNGLRNSEVHLPWFGPTDLADLSLFNTGQDASDLNGPGNNYVNSTNKPWAVYTPVQVFDYPIEKTDIVLAHLKFAQWSASNGAQYADWYLDLPGYRDSSKIYQKLAVITVNKKAPKGAFSILST